LTYLGRLEDLYHFEADNLLHNHISRELALVEKLTTINVTRIREDFPILKRQVNDKPLVYFDNAATSQKPKVVIDAIDTYYREYNANIHRGIHKLAEEATVAHEEAREKVAKFINAKRTEEIIFTRNATESLNLVAYSWGRTNIGKGIRLF